MEAPELNRPFHSLDDREYRIRGHPIFALFILFSVVLLFCLLFFYARWLCRYHRHLFPAGGGLALALEHSRGLHPARIKALPVTLYSSSFFAETSGECCICLGRFEEGEKVKSLPICNHCFHGDCVDRWLAAHPSCPMCRASLADETVVLAITPAVVP